MCVCAHTRVYLQSSVSHMSLTTCGRMFSCFVWLLYYRAVCAQGWAGLQGLYTVHLPVCAYAWQRDRLHAALSEVTPMSGHPQRMWASCKQTLASQSPLHLDINICQQFALYLCGECEILNVWSWKIEIKHGNVSAWTTILFRTRHHGC